jgi:hypothetical protein
VTLTARAGEKAESLVMDDFTFVAASWAIAAHEGRRASTPSR